ncbi:MAG: DUF4340 domain-containing protein [Planctomycetes bacterium]|nr:DUF4340 domain-containing protein [Planctomycetota bacterium]
MNNRSLVIILVILGVVGGIWGILRFSGSLEPLGGPGPITPGDQVKTTLFDGYDKSKVSKIVVSAVKPSGKISEDLLERLFAIDIVNQLEARGDTIPEKFFEEKEEFAFVSKLTKAERQAEWDKMIALMALLDTIGVQNEIKNAIGEDVTAPAWLNPEEDEDEESSDENAEEDAGENPETADENSEESVGENAEETPEPAKPAPLSWPSRALRDALENVKERLKQRDATRTWTEEALAQEETRIKAAMDAVDSLDWGRRESVTRVTLVIEKIGDKWYVKRPNGSIEINAEMLPRALASPGILVATDAPVSNVPRNRDRFGLNYLEGRQIQLLASDGKPVAEFVVGSSPESSEGRTLSKWRFFRYASLPSNLSDEKLLDNVYKVGPITIESETLERDVREVFGLVSDSSTPHKPWFRDSGTLFPKFSEWSKEVETIDVIFEGDIPRDDILPHAFTLVKEAAAAQPHEEGGPAPEDKWYLSDDRNQRIRTQTVKSFLDSGFGRLEIFDVLDPASGNSLLGSPWLTITLTRVTKSQAEGAPDVTTKTTVRFGAKFGDVVDLNYYMQVDGDPKVYLVQNWVVNSLAKKKEDFFDTTPIDPAKPIDPQPGEDEFVLPLGVPMKPE